MGRTKRRRLRKSKQQLFEIFNTDTAIIELNRWLKRNSWFNETKLKIASFPETGRGVMATKQFVPGDIIIELPFNLMISYVTLGKSKNFKLFLSSCNEILSIHELLSLYLVLELHLEKQSFWSTYINSLPTLDKISTLILCSEDELNYLNDDLLILVRKEITKLEDSWGQIKKILNTNYKCPHCGSRDVDIVTRDLYIWAHIIVNTRTVYVDPEKVLNASNSDLNNILADEPSMALCPFLDMINHSANTYTNAYLSDFNGNYFLVTNSTFKKYEQVFISYGAHDNKRLIYQYGFVLPQNRNDTIDFNVKEILSVLKITATSKQYKFIHDRNLHKNIYVAYSGFSFNMSAVLYILINEQEVDWSIRVYSSEYTKEQLHIMYKLAIQLLDFRLNQYKNKLEQLTTNTNSSRHFTLFLLFLNNQIDCINWILGKIETNMNS